MVDTDIAGTKFLTDQALPIGTTLSGDQFTIVGHLGAGGFGITYRAEDNVLGRTIVLKECFPSDLCFRDGANVVARNANSTEQYRSIVEMFMREARSLAKLRHPNIVGVHRAFEENETAYMAIDLIDGRDISDIIDKDAAMLSPARVKSILAQLLDAVETVHDADLLHRDISPDNIIIEKSGTPVLIDFGAARGDASRRTRAASVLMIVKDGYSPHELYVAGSEQSPCIDLYSLAATFYHVLSGEAPPNSQTRLVEIAAKNPDPCVPLAGRIKGYDEAFLQAIDEAMRIHPNERIQSAARWKSLISAEEVVQDAELPGARTSRDISMDLELTLSRLVEETNDEVKRISQIPVQEEKVVQRQEKPARPDWVEEFNRESMIVEPTPEAEEAEPGGDVSEATDEADVEAQAEPVEPAPVVALAMAGGTNWVDKALMKQERLRIEQEKMLEAQALEAFEAEHGTAVMDGGELQASDAALSRNRPLGIAIGILIGFGSLVLLQGL